MKKIFFPLTPTGSGKMPPSQKKFSPKSPIFFSPEIESQACPFTQV
jgi:hypothetical protein